MSPLPPEMPYDPVFFDSPGQVEIGVNRAKHNLPLHQVEPKMSSRAEHVLLMLPGVAMTADLEGLSTADLLEVPGCGPTTAAEIETVANSHGYELRGSAPPMLRRVRLGAALLTAGRLREAREVLRDVYPELHDACIKAGLGRDRPNDEELEFETTRPRLVIEFSGGNLPLQFIRRLGECLRKWTAEKDWGAALVVELPRRVEMQVYAIGDWPITPVVVRRDPR